MNTFLLLLRGINVGGKNKIPMADLRVRLEKLGFANVSTYIQSGNVILQSNEPETVVQAKIERMLPAEFTLDSSLIKVLVLDYQQLKHVIDHAPPGFGTDYAKHRYDVLFAMDTTAQEVMNSITLRPGIDDAWQGTGVVYFRRPSVNDPNATKSYLSKIMGLPIYKNITIRNWNTVTKLLGLMEDREK